MSTKLGEVKDAIHPKFSVQILTGTEGVQLLSTVNKIWLDDDGVKELIFLLELAQK